ncbi:MAG: ATP-dependent sacrificial sulfur transferase LarE [Bacteroidales bacterium]|nr:ATP-dependent sacrificial sulfur transferase LarE [Bacteroidales bacterium]
MGNKKYAELTRYLKSLEKVAVAFSGGVDSTLLLYVCVKVLGAENVSAYTIKTPYIPEWELNEALAFIQKHGIKQKILNSEIPENITHNPENRCYLCKSFIFSKLIQDAREHQIIHVLDGTNADDLGDYRPGMKALKELNVLSPFVIHNMGKQEIREISKEFGLETWDKPAYACLLTRIPYNTSIKISDLQKIERAEYLLHNMGFPETRVRLHDRIARLEFSNEHIQTVCSDTFRNKIIENLKPLGFEYITLDLQGYRMGSLNETISEKL